MVERTETVSRTYVETVNVPLPGGGSTTSSIIREDQSVLNVELPANITQRFKVEYIHVVDGENATGDVANNPNYTSRARSGNPGERVLILSNLFLVQPNFAS
jgi:hypothetical protein